MSKLDEATRKAREREHARHNGGEVPTALATTNPQALDIGSMRVPVEEVVAKVASGEWESAPRLYTIEKGETIQGMLEGNGPPAEVPDPRTKEIKPVDTWIISSLDASGIRISILTSAQLDRKLPPFVGGPVSITRGEEIETNSGGRVTDYFVAGPKRSDGSIRQWAKKPEHKHEHTEVKSS